MCVSDHQNSLTDTTTVELPQAAEIYTLSGNGNMRSSVMYLNGNALTLKKDDCLPDMQITIDKVKCMLYVIFN